MSKISSGLLMFRTRETRSEFFLVHPGGPFYSKKSEGVWSIPKGLIEQGEDPLDAAQREFFEETGLRASAPFTSLGTTVMKSGKVIQAWAFEGDWDEESGIQSNMITIAWPPRSGKSMEIPEVDRAEWMSREKAEVMIHPAQKIFLERFEHR